MADSRFRFGSLAPGVPEEAAPPDQVDPGTLEALRRWLLPARPISAAATGPQQGAKPGDPYENVPASAAEAVAMQPAVTGYRSSTVPSWTEQASAMATRDPMELLRNPTPSEEAFYGGIVGPGSIKGVGRGAIRARPTASEPFYPPEPPSSDPKIEQPSFWPPETEPKGITAYHGSPHDFERFDLSKIGTGEGAQAYGHGLYFAENPDTAEAYRQTFDLANRAARTSARLEGRDVPAEAAKANVYQVAINADPEHFLHWNKPLSEQSEYVQQRIKAIYDEDSINKRRAEMPLIGPNGPIEPRPATPVGKLTGAQVLERRGNPEEVTSLLREAGIPGIKYLDQGSRMPNADLVNAHRMAVAQRDAIKADPSRGRALGVSLAEAEKAVTDTHAELGANQPTHNYVVFDDKLIDILKKYGLAGLGIPGLAAAGTSEDK